MSTKEIRQIYTPPNKEQYFLLRVLVKSVGSSQNRNIETRLFFLGENEIVVRRLNGTN